MAFSVNSAFAIRKKYVCALCVLFLLPVSSGARRLPRPVLATSPTRRAAIPNVSVTATNVATNAKVEVHSDASGHYLIPSPPPTLPWWRRVQRFKNFVRSGIEPAVQQQAKLDIAMAPRDLTETCLPVTCRQSTGEAQFAWKRMREGIEDYELLVAL
jgi:hypothetical protein